MYVCIYIYVCIYVYICICMYICIHMYMYVCVMIYVGGVLLSYSISPHPVKTAALPQILAPRGWVKQPWQPCHRTPPRRRSLIRWSSEEWSKAGRRPRHFWGMDWFKGTFYKKAGKAHTEWLFIWEIHGFCLRFFHQSIDYGEFRGNVMESMGFKPGNNGMKWRFKEDNVFVETDEIWEWVLRRICNWLEQRLGTAHFKSFKFIARPYTVQGGSVFSCWGASYRP